jgi:hypothetical protein
MDGELDDGDGEKLDYESQQDPSEKAEVGSIIYESGRTTALQRKWIDAMSEAKDPVVEHLAFWPRALF